MTRPTKASKESAPRSLWRNPDYMSWWTGMLFSTTGASISAVALPLLLIYEQGSVFAAALVGTAERLGALLTRLLGGALADRQPRRRILVAGSLTQAATMASIAWSAMSPHLHVPVLVGLAALLGLVSGLVDGAVTPALRRLVPRSQFAARAAQEQGLHQVSQLAGGPLAGVLFAVGRGFPFVADACSYLVATIANAAIRAPLGPDRSETARPSLWADVRAGVAVVARNRFLRYTAGWAAVTNLVGNSVILLTIALLKEQGAGPSVVGVTNAGILLGGVLAALLAGRIIRAFKARSIFLVGNLAYVVTLGAVALTRTPWQVAVTAGAFVFATVPTASIWESYVAALVPDELFGRVGATMTAASQSLTWVGTLIAGALADGFGANIAIAAFAALLVPYAVANVHTPALDILRRPISSVSTLPE